MKRIIIIGTEPLIITEIPYIMLFLHALPVTGCSKQKSVRQSLAPSLIACTAVSSPIFPETTMKGRSRPLLRTILSASRPLKPGST